MLYFLTTGLSSWLESTRQGGRTRKSDIGPSFGESDWANVVANPGPGQCTVCAVLSGHEFNPVVTSSFAFETTVCAYIDAEI